MNAPSRISPAERRTEIKTRKTALRTPTLLSWLMLGLAVGFFVLFLVQAGTFKGLTALPPEQVEENITQEKVVVGASSMRKLSSKATR